MSIKTYYIVLFLTIKYIIELMGINESISTEIKILLAKKCWTQEKLAQELGKRLNKKYTGNNLTKKIRSETIPYREIKLIADILGYKIIFEDIDSNS